MAEAKLEFLLIRHMGKEKTMQNQEIFKRPVWKAIFSMGIPSLISGSGYDNLQHGGYVFHWLLNDYTQVAAVSLIMPVFSIMTAVSMLLEMVAAP